MARYGMFTGKQNKDEENASLLDDPEIFVILKP